MHQVVVKIDGWREVSPVSVDRVGVYFRQADPEINTSSSLVNTYPYKYYMHIPHCWDYLESVDALCFTFKVVLTFWSELSSFNPADEVET